MDYSSIMSDPNSAAGLGALLGAAIGVLIFIAIIAIVVSVLLIIGMWKMFKKAGEPGWAAIIPVYNTFVFVKVAKLDWWHFLIYFGLSFAISILGDTLAIIVSLVVIAYYFVINIRLAKAFGKSGGFGVFTAFFPYIGYMILGCGSATYEK